MSEWRVAADDFLTENELLKWMVFPENASLRHVRRNQSMEPAPKCSELNRIPVPVEAMWLRF